MAHNQPDTRIVPWVRSPRQLDFFSTWSPAEVKLWTAINSATQINTRQGRISVPALARHTGYSQRSIYRILRRLKDRGAIYALISPGRTAVYYLPHEYSAPRTTPTHDNRGRVPNKVVIDNTRSPRKLPYSRYVPWRVPPAPTALAVTCYQSYNEYAATSSRPVPLDTWVSG